MNPHYIQFPGPHTGPYNTKIYRIFGHPSHESLITGFKTSCCTAISFNPDPQSTNPITNSTVPPTKLNQHNPLRLPRRLLKINGISSSLTPLMRIRGTICSAAGANVRNDIWSKGILVAAYVESASSTLLKR